MSPKMRALLVLLVAVAEGARANLYYGGAMGQVMPLAVLAESPLYVANSLSRVPLLLVPQREVTMINGARISAVSATQPVVTCQLPKYTLDATPAVRVQLERPLLVNAPEAMVGFPAEVSVFHEGLRISVPVGALLAPVHTLPGPHVIRVLYAVPTTPLYLSYPFFSPFAYPYRPMTSDDKKITDMMTGMDKKPESGMTGMDGRPLVTVLDFPTELAQPQSLFYQPPLDESDELGNKGPPEAVVPAGIVQSTQPRPYKTPFNNSKESPLLQSLRDQAEQTKSEVEEEPESTGAEAL